MVDRKSWLLWHPSLLALWLSFLALRVSVAFVGLLLDDLHEEMAGEREDSRGARQMWLMSKLRLFFFSFRTLPPLLGGDLRSELFLAGDFALYGLIGVLRPRAAFPDF